MPVPVATAGPEHNGGAAMLEPNYGLGIGVRPVHGAVYGPGRALLLLLLLLRLLLLLLPHLHLEI